MSERERAFVQNQPDDVAFRCFPSHDVDLLQAVRDATAMLAENLNSLGLEMLLRPEFPGARVVEQNALASMSHDRLFYVFRDGNIHAEDSDGPGTPAYRSAWVRSADTIEHSIRLLERSSTVRATVTETFRRVDVTRRRMRAADRRLVTVRRGLPSVTDLPGQAGE